MLKIKHFYLLLLVIFSLTAFANKTNTNMTTDYFVKIVNVFEDSQADRKTKLTAIEDALKELQANPEYPHHNYWKAVLTTFQCEIKDKGRLIPFCITSNLSEIKSLLKQSHQSYPSYYHYAPARTLGIMYLQMPALVGGSRKKAIEYLTEAYEGAPDFKDNKIWLDKARL